MDYKSKYLKYKNKYLILKEQLGTGMISHQFRRQVPEFELNTRPEYVSNVQEI